jgi:uncharacterized repeat protein (TIGR01451 family)
MITRVRIATMALFLLVAAGAAAQNDVLVIGAVSPEPWLEDVRTKIEATGMFDQVDSYNAYLTGTPSLALMQNYCAVLVFTDFIPQDPVTLGNNLADYIDGGGGVVVAAFATASVPITGRFQTDNYYALQPVGTHASGNPQALGTVLNACHPVLDNVTSFSGGTSSYRPSSDSLHPSAVRIANWTDGRALIVERSINGRLRIDLGFFPVSDAARSDFWTASTDGARILANALQYVSSCATPSADLSIANTDAVDPVEPGSNITYTIDVDNLGPYAAETLVITDVLPAGMTYVSATGENSSCSFNAGTSTVTCTLSSLASCADEVITLVVNAPAGTPSGTILTHTAAVTSATADPDTTNNSETESTTVLVLSPELVLTKTAAPEPVVAGQNLTYTIDVDNTSVAAASAVVVSDTIPAGTTFVSATGENSSCAFSSGTVTCTLASLPGGTDEIITVVVTVNASVASGTILTNTATVSSTPADPTPANNQDSVSSTVTTTADLSITKSGPASASPNGIITYTIAITNGGPSHASAVVLTDALPADTTFVSMDAAAGFTCTTPAVGATGTVTCTNPTMALGTATFTLRVEVATSPTASAITNTASVSSTSADPDGADTAASATTAVAAAATAAVPSLSVWGLWALTASILALAALRLKG